MQPHKEINLVIDHLFRHEAGKMVAVLTRLFGFPNIGQAEDIVHDTLLAALETWKFDKIPPNPQAWLYHTAKNKAIDMVRRQKVAHRAAMSLLLTSEYSLVPTMDDMFTEHEIRDSMLRMIFACCHHSLTSEAQISLILKSLCGLSVREIANAFLTKEDTIQKRIYRTKEKLRDEKITLEYPVGKQAIAIRTGAVLKALYLLFNEGYYSSHPEQLIREDLCAEAIRLALLLTENENTNLPETNALLALMCYHTSRFGSRMDDKGMVILLKDQDRTLWDKELIAKGNEYMQRAACGNIVHEFHIEAAIASLHAHAAGYEQTNWKAILNLYNMLYALTQNPMVALNQCIVSGEIYGPEYAISALEQLKSLQSNCHYNAALGEQYMKTGQTTIAKDYYNKALALTSSISEAALIRRKIEAVYQ